MLSFVTILITNGKLAILKVQIETGWTHQIREHLQHERTSVDWDEVDRVKDWNGRLRESTGIDRPLLHALRLEVEYPVTGGGVV